jgi:hypothetical protein
MGRWNRGLAVIGATLLALVSAGSAAGATGSGITVTRPVDVTADSTAQNETPLAINPANPSNMITGNNDWNYHDGCDLNVTFNAGRTWTPSLPNGFLPAITKFTNDPNVPGTGLYDAGGDPAIAFSPDGRVAYYVCQAFNFTPPYQIALLLNRSHDGGRTWETDPAKLVQISTWNGNGQSKGSNGQFPDHESIHVDPVTGAVYVTWAQFSGNTHSPVFVSVSHDSGTTWSAPVQVTASTVRNNQDQRITTDEHGVAYLTFDNGIQGGKGTALYASKSADGGRTWSTPVQFVTLVNPVCTFPPYCFNIPGGPFRSGGSYPAPAYDTVRDRLDVVVPDIVGRYGQVYFYSLDPGTLHVLSGPTAVATAAGDQFQNELSIAPNGRIDVSFYDRSYSGNALVDLTYATSGDGGATWRKARVTTAGFDPSTWGVPSSSGFRPFIGDYNGIASTDTFAGMTWTGVAPPQPYNLETNYATATP